MKKEKISLIKILLIIGLVVVLAIIIIDKSKNNLVKLNYREIIEKIDNKEDFVLCISKTDCVHCQNYKPKLKKISNDYNIITYYIDIDTLKDEEYEDFKNKLNFDGSTPITIFIKEGEEKTTATRIEGDASSRTIISKLKSNGFIK